MQEGHSVEELMQLRAQIDQELNQRLTKTLCLMFADVVGSTSFFQKYGDVQGRLFIQRHHDILSPLVSAHGGRVVKTIGDAVMAAFEEPQRALDCALAMQQKLWETNQNQPKEEDTCLQTKISLHYGSALVEENDIYGDLVNMSARISAMAEPDQILVSHTVYDQVKARKEPPFLPLETVGWKEGERGISVYEVLWRQQADTPDKPVVFRTFEGAYRACFYCGLPEHPVSRCPSKQLTGHRRRLEQLGYLPLRDILDLFRQEDLNTSTPPYAKGGQVCEAFYEVSLPYQLRFLTKVWLASSGDLSTLERYHQTATAHSLIGTRLWKGFDCLRVGRYDEARGFLRTAMESNPSDYKPHIVLGLLALETEESPIALQHWRKSLTLANTTLQSAYIHLLMHRLYIMNGKTELARQELQKALAKDPYLYEAKYRQVALLVKEDNEKKVLTQLQALIQDDRRVYVQVMLDPAFAPLRDEIHPMLSTLFQEARTEAIEQMNRVTEALNTLREWYLHPERELTAMEHSLDRMRRHIKSDSYFGYRDAVHEGTILQAKIQQLTGQRQTHLKRDFAATLATVQAQLTACANCSLARQAPMATQLAKYQHELTCLQSQTSFSGPRQFWQAWKALQKLQTAVQELLPTPQRQTPTGPKEKWCLLSLLLFGVGGSILVDSALFAILGYLTYASGLRLPESQLLLFLACGAFGGMLLGSTVGWLVHWYRSRP